MYCCQRFHSRGGEGAHFFKKHGHIAPLRRLFEDTWCPCCQKEFHTPVKMQLHLRKSGRCRRDVWARGHLFQAQQGIGSQCSRQQAAEHDVALPPQITQGPSLQPVQPRELSAENVDLIMKMVDALADRTEQEDILAFLKEEIQRAPLSWTQRQANVEQFHGGLWPRDGGDPASESCFDDEGPVKFLWPADPQTWDFLVESTSTEMRPSDALDHYEFGATTWPPHLILGNCISQSPDQSAETELSYTHLLADDESVIINGRRKFRSETSDNMDSWKAEVRRVRRDKIRRKKMQMREKVGKSRNTVFFQWFGAPEGRKVGSLKRRVRSQLARWEMKNCTPLWREAHFQVKMYKTHQLRTTFGSWDVEKVHAVVARSTFPSQNVQNTPAPDHFSKLRCRKSARRCGAKHISKSKCTKHTNVGPLLEVEMSKKCTPLWREAHFQVKSVNNWRSRTTFGGSDVEKVSKKCTPLWREAHSEVKSVKNSWFWAFFDVKMSKK